MSAARYRFAAGRIHPKIEIDGRLLVLCALAVALLRLAFGVLVALNPDAAVLDTPAFRLMWYLGPTVPVFLLLRAWNVFDIGYSALMGIEAWALGNGAFWAMGMAASFGGPFAALNEPPVWWLSGACLQFLGAWLLVRGLFIWKTGSWEGSVWTTPKRAWPILPLRDVGVGVGFASVLIWIYACTLWLVYDVGLVAVAFVVLIVSAVADKMHRRTPGSMLEIDPDLPIDQQRLAVCRQLEAEPYAAEGDLLVGRAVWFRDALTMTRVDTSEGSRWLVAGVDALWDRRFWTVPRERFEIVRPDLAALLDLPPGWVITTSPGEVRFDPGTGSRLVQAAIRSRLCLPTQEFLDRLVPVIASDVLEDA